MLTVSRSNAVDMYTSRANAANCFSKWSFESNVRQDTVIPTNKNNAANFAVARIYMMSHIAVLSCQTFQSVGTGPMRATSHRTVLREFDRERRSLLRSAERSEAAVAYWETQNWRLLSWANFLTHRKCKHVSTYCSSVKCKSRKKQNTVKNSGHSEAEQKSAFVLATEK